MIEMAAGDLVGVLLDPYSEIDNASELTVPLIEEIDYNSGVLLQTLEVHT